MKKQIPEMDMEVVGNQLDKAVELIDNYAMLIGAVGDLADTAGACGLDIGSCNSRMEECVAWIGWYEELTGRDIL